MFRIKICGITSVADAQAAVDAGADCIGLNLFSGSPRFVEMPRAREIRNAVRGTVLVAGVFVNASPEQIRDTHHELSLDLIQLSGNESAEMLARLSALVADVPVMLAVRVAADGVDSAESLLDECRRRQCMPHLVLWDAYDPRQFGGTGRIADWSAATAYVAASRSRGVLPPLVLAGGLRPENVAEAIRAVRPQAVDTASGVESRPGVKDAILVTAFAAAARAAFDKGASAD